MESGKGHGRASKEKGTMDNGQDGQRKGGRYSIDGKRERWRVERGNGDDGEWKGGRWRVEKGNGDDEERKGERNSVDGKGNEGQRRRGTRDSGEGGRWRVERGMMESGKGEVRALMEKGTMDKTDRGNGVSKGNDGQWKGGR